MTNISDYDLKQMDEVWQGKLAEPAARALLKRTLEDLRVARDRLNQNPGNSSRPSGSMPPWQCGDATAKDNATDLTDEQDAEEEECTGGEPAKGAKPTSNEQKHPSEPAEPWGHPGTGAHKSSHLRNLSTSTPMLAPDACTLSQRMMQPLPGQPGIRWNCVRWSTATPAYPPSLGFAWKLPATI